MILTSHPSINNQQPSQTSTMDQAKDNAQAYFGRARPEMLEFIPRSAQRILDVGCGSGGFAAQLMKPGKEVWGIEPDPAMAALASKQLTKTFCSDIETALGHLPVAYFDCVVFNDVLEHLVDPFSVLRQVQRYLCQGGCIVASIPNVRYFYNLREVLLDRQWRYRNFGILDRTHLRFFTEISMADMFADAGYRLIRQQGINGFKSWKFSILNALTRGHVADMRYEQFACVAQSRATAMPY